MSFILEQHLQRRIYHRNDFQMSHRLPLVIVLPKLCSKLSSLLTSASNKEEGQRAHCIISNVFSVASKLSVFTARTRTNDRCNSQAWWELWIVMPMFPSTQKLRTIRKPIVFRKGVCVVLKWIVFSALTKYLPLCMSVLRKPRLLLSRWEGNPRNIHRFARWILYYECCASIQLSFHQQEVEEHG